jgi:hypothetical protein
MISKNSEKNLREMRQSCTVDKGGQERSRLSCAKYLSNRVRLALFVLAYNLGNFLRRFALPREMSHWSLTSIQLKLLKIGAKIISHSRMTVFQMAEAPVPERLFLLDAIENPPPGQGMRESARLELVKDGNRKQSGFKCGTTVSRQRENTRPGGISQGQAASGRQTPVNRAGKARLLIGCRHWRRHMKDVGLITSHEMLGRSAHLAHLTKEVSIKWQGARGATTFS